MSESTDFGTGEFGGDFGAAASTDVPTMISDALRMSGVSSTDSEYREVALAFANQVYLTVLKGRHWKFMNKELFLESFAPYAKGTIEAEHGSHSIKQEDGTSGIVWNSNHKGQLLAVGASSEYYRILDVKSGQELEVTSGFIGDTVSSTSHSVLNDRFLLPADVQAIRSLSIVGHREIKPEGIQTFRSRKESNPTLKGTPEIYTLVDSRAQDGSRTLEVYPAPDSKFSIYLEYSQRPERLVDSDTCFIALPPEHGDVMTLGIRAKIYQDQNNIQLAQSVGSEAAAAWNRMAGDQELTDSRARIQMGRKYFNRRRNKSVYYGTKHFGKF